MTTDKPKKRNPQDTTLRNTRAANKKFDDLFTAVEAQQRLLAGALDRLAALEARVSAVDGKTV